MRKSVEENKQEALKKIEQVLWALELTPNNKEHLELSITNLLKVFPNLSMSRFNEVADLAASGKYGVPFKYAPALIGSWFHKYNSDRAHDLKGRL